MRSGSSGKIYRDIDVIEIDEKKKQKKNKRRRRIKQLRVGTVIRFADGC